MINCYHFWLSFFFLSPWIIITLSFVFFCGHLKLFMPFQIPSFLFRAKWAKMGDKANSFNSVSLQSRKICSVCYRTIRKPWSIEIKKRYPKSHIVTHNSKFSKFSKQLNKQNTPRLFISYWKKEGKKNVFTLNTMISSFCYPKRIRSVFLSNESKLGPSKRPRRNESWRQQHKHDKLMV